MWGKRKEEEAPAPRPAAPAPPVYAEPVKKEVMPVSSTPVRSPEPEVPRNVATIGKSVAVKGKIDSREELFVDGEVEGTIEMSEHRLTIGPNGNVAAGIRAREIVILGRVQGDVEVVDKIDIRKDAKLVGNIKTARIIIEDGAYFKGSIDIVKPGEPVVKPIVAAPPPPVAVAPAPRPQPVLAPAPQAAAAAGTAAPSSAPASPLRP